MLKIIGSCLIGVGGFMIFSLSYTYADGDVVGAFIISMCVSIIAGSGVFCCVAEDF